MVNNFLRRRAGVSSADLADTATLMNGLDEIEDSLDAGKYGDAINIANQVSYDMLEDEGFPLGETYDHYRSHPDYDGELDDIYRDDFMKNMTVDQAEQILSDYKTRENAVMSGDEQLWDVAYDIAHTEYRRERGLL